jgi:hypothetical protein
VRFSDALARGLITLGGIGTILAVLGVGVFLLVVAAPLFRPARTAAAGSAALADAPPLAVGGDESGDLGWVLSAAGLRGLGLANGKTVKIEGRTSAASNALATTPVTASKVECKTDGATFVPPVPQVAEGVIYDLASDKGAFKVNGQTFWLDGETAFSSGKSRADLANGLAVLVKAVVINGKLMARQIELRAPAAATPQTIRISGTVREFESAAKFMVGPVKVDASAARFVNGAAADLKAGALVEVTGTPNSSNAALKATQVRFL